MRYPKWHRLGITVTQYATNKNTWTLWFLVAIWVAESRLLFLIIMLFSSQDWLNIVCKGFHLVLLGILIFFKGTAALTEWTCAASSHIVNYELLLIPGLASWLWPAAIMRCTPCGRSRHDPRPRVSILMTQAVDVSDCQSCGALTAWSGRAQTLWWKKKTELKVWRQTCPHILSIKFW